MCVSPIVGALALERGTGVNPIRPIIRHGAGPLLLFLFWWCTTPKGRRKERTFAYPPHPGPRSRKKKRPADCLSDGSSFQAQSHISSLFLFSSSLPPWKLQRVSGSYDGLAYDLQRGGRRIERRGKRESANALFIDAATSPVGAATERTPVQPFFRKKGVKREEERVLMDQWQDFLILLCSAAHSQLCTKKKSKIAGDHRNSKWSVKVGLLTRFSLIFLFWRGFYWHFATTRLVSFHVSPHASLDIKRLVTFSSFLLLLPVVLYISSSTDCPVGTCHFTFSSIRRDDIVGGLDVSARNNGQPTSSVFFPLCQ